MEEIEKIELDLENPIFAFYINVANLPRQQVDQIMSHFTKLTNYSNVTCWILASDVTKVECVYDGKSKIRDKEISRFIKEINKRVDILSNSRNFEDFKINIRDWRLKEIIENESQKE